MTSTFLHRPSSSALRHQKAPSGEWFAAIIARGMLPVPVTSKTIRHLGECAVFSIADMQEYALKYISEHGGVKKSGLAYGYLAHWIGWGTAGAAKKFFILPRLSYARKRLFEHMYNEQIVLQDFRRWDLEKKEWSFNTIPEALPADQAPPLNLATDISNYREEISHQWYRRAAVRDDRFASMQDE